MSRTAGGRNAEQRGGEVFGMTWVFLAHSHQCLGTKPSSLFHQLASLCQKVWERLFITTSWFPASLPYPSFLSCGLARSKGVAGHTASLPSMWLPLSPISKFTPFSPFPPHGLQVTFQWTCYVRVGLVLACHTEICVYSSAFLFYTTPGKHWHWNRSSSKSLARKCQWIKCTLLKIIFYRVIVSRHAAPLFCILGGKTQVCNINFLLKTT